MNPLFLEPVDVWLFRDGKPFDAGRDHRARSLFPPFPSAIQGALRSFECIRQGINLNDKNAVQAAVGTTDDYGVLRLKGPYLARCTNGSISRFFPVPADAVPLNDREFHAVTPTTVRPGCLTSQQADPPRLLLDPAPFRTKSAFGDWLTEADLSRFLAGEPVQPLPAAELFVRENRLGIEIEPDRRRTTKEGQLYQAEFIRPLPGIGLAVEMSGYTNWPVDGLLRLGGEAHAASFYQVQPLAWPAPPAPLPKLFKVYFATPAFFSNGWKPQSWNRFFDGEVALEAAALKGYESIGGYDWANNRQKSMRRFIPAGSVYYFSSDGSARLKMNLLQNAITETPYPDPSRPGQHLAAIGFGQVIISEWKES